MLFMMIEQTSIFLTDAGRMQRQSSLRLLNLFTKAVRVWSDTHLQEEVYYNYVNTMLPVLV